jgi:hypothetical protein
VLYYWFIVPDQENRGNRFALGIDYLGSSIWLTHSRHGRLLRALSGSATNLDLFWQSVFSWNWGRIADGSAQVC